ncbi:MAG: hypothetical protein Q9207_001384 [Kuettlingeria erythrocarpa]
MSATNPESAFTFLSQGALIQEFKVAGQNIVQSFPEASFYKTHNDVYLGETIGRTTNRVKGARLDNLNGQSYTLAANDGNNPNSLHGGLRGWGKQDFEGPKPVNRNGKEGVRFRYLSEDGEEGYPGTVECFVWYTAGMEDHKTVLEVEYQVELVGDECEETVCGVRPQRKAQLSLWARTNTSNSTSTRFQQAASRGSLQFRQKASRLRLAPTSLPSTIASSSTPPRLQAAL